MAENKFAITITAVDKASAVVNKVNKSVGKAFRPYDNAKKSLKSFSDALGRNDLVRRPLWALEKVGAGVTRFGGAFGLAENSVLGGSARIASALGMVGGPIGGFLAGTAALVGGSTAVSVAMANMGLNISRTAKNLNIGTTTLQEYRGAAKLAGLQTEAMDSSLLSLGQTLQEADFGRNPVAAEALNRMGVAIHRNKDGAVDTVRAFRDISDVVSHMSDQNMARKLTDLLGVTEMLPLLREGSGKLDEFIAKQRQLGIQSEEQIQRNAQQAQSWNETKTAIDSAAVSVGNLIGKWLDLNAAAQSTSAAAERLQKSGGLWDTLSVMGGEIGRNIWNHSPNAYIFRKMFGEMKPPRQPEGSWADAPHGATGSWDEAPAQVRGADASKAVPGSQSPMGLRNNNPGNLRSWPGATVSGGFASFDTPEAGLSAMAKNLVAYQDKYRINTVSGIVNRWAPAKDGNNVPAYMADVSKQTGFGADQKLDLHDPKVLAPLLSAITKHENGQNPYTPEMLSQAIASALHESKGGDQERPITVVVHNVPAGMTVKAVRGLGGANVGLAMAPGGTS